MRTLPSLLAAGLALAAFAAPARLQERDIVATAAGDARFSTLVSLVKQAGLVETLQGPGPFTVLAPTDAAFAKVPKAALDKIAGDPTLLKKVLTYHVLSGKILSTDLKTMSAPTVEGESIKVKVGKKGKVHFNRAGVVQADVQTSNGVIHAIDAVLLPPSVAKTLGLAPTPKKTGGKGPNATRGGGAGL